VYTLSGSKGYTHFPVVERISGHLKPKSHRSTSMRLISFGTELMLGIQYITDAWVGLAPRSNSSKIGDLMK
jgi:hypothetical protein